MPVEWRDHTSRFLYIESRSQIEFREGPMRLAARSSFPTLQRRIELERQTVSRSTNDRRFLPDLDIGGVDLQCGLRN